MKKLPALVIAAVIVGFLAFAFSYWIMRMEYQLALTTGVGAGVAGLVVELVKPWWQKKNDAAETVRIAKVEKNQTSLKQKLKANSL